MKLFLDEALKKKNPTQQNLQISRQRLLCTTRTSKLFSKYFTIYFPRINFFFLKALLKA